MLVVIRKDTDERTNMFRFNCDRCGSIWVTDEVRYVDGSNFYMIVSDCPCCGKKDVNAKGYMG